VVELELRRIATLDPLGVFEGREGPDGTVRFRIKELAAMSPDVRACIASIKVRVENLGSGDRKQDETIEIKFWDKVKALELCAKHFGWVKTEASPLLGKELRALLEAGRARNAARKQLTEGAVEGEVVTPEGREPASVPRETAAPAEEGEVDM
jgi:hypothetical protein